MDTGSAGGDGKVGAMWLILTITAVAILLVALEVRSWRKPRPKGFSLPSVNRNADRYLGGSNSFDSHWRKPD